MELVISQLTAIVRKLEEHEFQKIAEVLEEDRSDQIDGVIANMVCLAETLVRFLQNKNPFTKNSERKATKKISNEAMHDSFIHTDFYEKYLHRMQGLRVEHTSPAPP